MLRNIEKFYKLTKIQQRMQKVTLFHDKRGIVNSLSKLFLRNKFLEVSIYHIGYAGSQFHSYLTSLSQALRCS